jgi:hypothetical protein
MNEPVAKTNIIELFFAINSPNYTHLAMKQDAICVSKHGIYNICPIYTHGFLLWITTATAPATPTIIVTTATATATTIQEIINTPVHILRHLCFGAIFFSDLQSQRIEFLADLFRLVEKSYQIFRLAIFDDHPDLADASEMKRHDTLDFDCSMIPFEIGHLFTSPLERACD